MIRRHKRARRSQGAGHGVYFLPNLPTLPEHSRIPVDMRVLDDVAGPTARFELPIAHQYLPISAIALPMTGVSQ